MRVSFRNGLADAMGQRFLTHLSRTAARRLRESSEELIESVVTETQKLFDARVASVADRPGRVMLAACCITLASFRELARRTGDRELAFDIVHDAFRRTYQLPAKLLTRALLAWSPDPFSALPRLRLKERGQMVFGASMGFEESSSPDVFELSVTRCAFHGFFAEEGEPGLTSILCDWDRNWMDVVDASKRPLHTERPSTISTGGDRCRFRFVRDQPGAGAAGDVMSERFPQRSVARRS